MFQFSIQIKIAIYDPNMMIIMDMDTDFNFLLIAENYRSVASDLCSLAKSQGSRDNISVIVVYLKEPHLIATQSWPSQIQQTKDIMENLNMYEEQPVVGNAVTMDALGNTNQVRDKTKFPLCRLFSKISLNASISYQNKIKMHKFTIILKFFHAFLFAFKFTIQL